MTQRFIKGYTNNHLTWVMVDATDFATPESALSAATKIKIYGKVKGATGVNFVSSGTGSLTNDIQHVGASALGIYTIALAKADLSDASAAWYDQYIVALSATGAAYQTIVVDGGIMESYLSGAVSDTLSGVVALSDAVSNVHSEMTSQFAVVSNYLSNASNFQSDILSTMGSQFAVVSNYLSNISAMVSDMDSAANSQYSDLDSKLTSVHSDLKSAIGAVSVTLSASDISDIASAVIAGGVPTASQIADKVWSDYGSKVGVTPSQAYSVAVRAASFASDAASGVTVLQSRITSTAATSSDLVSKIEAGLMSDIYSLLSDTRSTMDSQFAVTSNYLSNASNFQSDISSTLGSQFAVISNYLSSISAISSDAHSAAILAASNASEAQSNILLVQSRLSDFMSAIYPSDISDIRSMLTALSDAVSNVDSAADSQYSDLASKLTALSDAVSNVDSAISSQYSDLASKVGGVSVALSASDISDLASQVVEAIGSAVMDVNVVQVNEIAVSGAGTAANPWGPG